MPVSSTKKAAAPDKPTLRVLLVIPSVVKRGVEKAVAQDRHPTMDYWALAACLRERGCEVELLDYQTVEGSRLPRDPALALAGYRRRNDFDAIFTNGENVALPLALLLKTARARPRHITIGHRLSTPKKRGFFTLAKAHRQIDRIFVYATAQYRHAHGILGIEAARLALIPFHADADFFRPLPEVATKPDQICSAGLEWRDYPTLIESARLLPELSFKLAAASPWSKHTNETANRTLPANVEARRYEYHELRQLYAQSAAVVVPLYETDFQAGVTTILEAMAVGKPVIATATQGQTDVILEEKTGIYVPPGDSEALAEAIQRIQKDSTLRARLGKNAREWLEANATLSHWARTIADDLCRTEALP